MKSILLLTFFVAATLFATVENSILPMMDQLTMRDLSGKISQDQQQVLEQAYAQKDQALRVASFNMLFNLPFSERKLEWKNKWKNREPRLIEYIEYLNADIIGSQELQKKQLDSIMDVIGNEYNYYGVGARDGDTKGDIAAVFYKKERLQLIEGKTYYFSETPEVVSKTPFGHKNTFSVCYFLDLLTDQTFLVVNTHLAFGNINRREYETKLLSAYIQSVTNETPLIVTGDFNTFPFRQELELPFYDGDAVMATIENSGVKDSQKLAVFGHFGPISSSNFSQDTQRAFASLGTPGVILDHIFVNQDVKILAHGIDPATVNGYWPSDHFVVVVDLFIPTNLNPL